MRSRRLLRLYKKEKNADVKERILLNLLIERDKMSAATAAAHLCKSSSWGSKWRRRYMGDKIKGLQTLPRSGRPPLVEKEVMDQIRQKN